jgi:thiol-disulfide isomerase/thioredoxin
MEIGTKTIRAPEIYGEYWFNSEPLALSALHGQVVLLHFWDFTRVNCLRTLPYLKEWDRRYRDLGLVLIGVHTPEFTFARNPEVVEQAIRRLGISYPVVTDNEYLIWTAFRNTAWPATYLVDRDGYIKFYHLGEGNYISIEHTLQALLVEAGYHGELPMLLEPLREEDRPGALCYRATPEIYTGYARGTIGNVEGLNLDSTIEYVDPSVYVDGRFYAHGRWFVDRDFMRYAGEVGSEGYILVPYHALEANAVLRPEEAGGFEVDVTQDDEPLKPDILGGDVRMNAVGRSILTVREGRVFNLVRNREFGKHILKLATSSNSSAIYSFAFVSAAIPEVVPTDRA